MKTVYHKLSKTANIYDAKYSSKAHKFSNKKKGGNDDGKTGSKSESSSKKISYQKGDNDEGKTGCEEGGCQETGREEGGRKKSGREEGGRKKSGREEVLIFY
jgi:hypothetical protein